MLCKIIKSRNKAFKKYIWCRSLCLSRRNLHECRKGKEYNPSLKRLFLSHALTVRYAFNRIWRRKFIRIASLFCWHQASLALGRQGERELFLRQEWLYFLCRLIPRKICLLHKFRHKVNYNQQLFTYRFSFLFL